MVNRILILTLLLPLTGIAAESMLLNATRKPCPQAMVRLKTPAPQGAFIVRENGREVPYQVEEIAGQRSIWICSDFAPGAKHQYEVAAGAPTPVQPRVALRREGDAYLLDNGIVAVKTPARFTGFVGPILSVRLADGWVAGSSWSTSLRPTKLTSTVIADGTLFAKVRLRYEFDGMAGLDGTTAAFAEVDITLTPGARHIEVFERHEMGRQDFWELEVSRGWTPTRGISKPFSGGAGSGKIGGKPAPDRELLPNGLPYSKPDLFINLFPRWNQHYKDGWAFAATDGANVLGAIVVKAGRWVWPHNNAIEAIVKESGDYAGLRCSTWKGQRLWWLVTSTEPINIAYLTRYAFEDLDKLNHEFILEWPGVTKGSFAGMNLYDGGQMNPSSGIRGVGRRAIADAGKPGDLTILTRAQVMFHNDTWGSYYDYWSPENPNFFTDFVRGPIAMVSNLKGHPDFERFRRMAEAKFREDVDHTITLPGGAGQECPGYVAHALAGWRALAPVCREHLGFDPTTWERFKAGEQFLKRISQPDGDRRRELPIGDTHPDRKDAAGPKFVEVPASEVRKWTTEEIPGFGVIFQNNAGTPRETYLSFKAGPNRGHYHGDQLAFHYCADARALAVDHHCSYSPRAGQEHMHNRLAFGVDRLPWANMDGYERLIAFKTGREADIAIGQVESDRLREITRLPPEIWHQEHPQHAFKSPLIYRRTMVMVKGDARDYFIIRDQYWASEPLTATYCLHVRSEKIEQRGQTIDFGNLTLYCAAPATFAFESFPWSHENGGREQTQGARLTIKADKAEFITVMYPGKAPAISRIPGGVSVGTDEITFTGDQPTTETTATVRRNDQIVLSLTGGDINLDRPQGDIGLFVPDAGYPFGEIPAWLIRQRVRR